MARDALFDLAVARALTYVLRARVADLSDTAALQRALEVWYLKTRFAYRVPLEQVVQALAAHPEAASIGGRGGPRSDEAEAAGELRWSGGASGGWTR